MTQTAYNQATLSAMRGSVEIKTDDGARILITPACARALADQLARYAALADGLPHDASFFVRQGYSRRDIPLQ